MPFEHQRTEEIRFSPKRTPQFPKNPSMRRLDSQANRRTVRGTQFRSELDGVSALRSKRGFSASPFFAYFQNSVDDRPTVRLYADSSANIHATYAEAGALDVQIAGSRNRFSNSVCLSCKKEQL